MATVAVLFAIHKLAAMHMSAPAVNSPLQVQQLQCQISTAIVRAALFQCSYI